MKIFISSTAYDLSDFRALMVEILQARGHEVIYHESPTFPAKLHLHSHDQCTLAVEKCDIVICVIDRRYGGKYKGVFPNKFPNQNIEVLGCTRKGLRKKYNVEIKTSDLSITWCELITAYDKQIPVITFARQKSLDEKETRRKNQYLASFQPSYVEKNEVFDLLDWITKRPSDNWIVSYTDIVDFRKKLLVWIEEVELSIHPGTIVSDQSLTETEQLPVSSEGLSLIQDHVPKEQAKICIIVEGETDRVFVNFLIRKLKLNNYFVVIPSYGKYRTLNNFDSTIAKYASVFDHVIVLTDTDTNDEYEIEKMYEMMIDLVKKSGRDNIKIQLAVPEIESWIAAGLNHNVYNEYNGAIDKTLFNKLFFAPTIDNISYILKMEYNLDAAMGVSKDLRSFVEVLLSIGKKRYI